MVNLMQNANAVTFEGELVFVQSTGDWLRMDSTAVEGYRIIEPPSPSEQTSAGYRVIRGPKRMDPPPAHYGSWADWTAGRWQPLAHPEPIVPDVP